jgi:signal transduction histidine kinase
MYKNKLLALLLTLLLSLGINKQSNAQTDSVTAVINILRSIRESKHFDTVLFTKHVDAVAGFILKKEDVLSLNETASLFDKGTNLDLDLYIRYRILTSLSRSDFYSAIDYAKEQLEMCDKNRGPNKIFLRLYFLNQLRIPYRSSDRIGEGFVFYNNILAKAKAAGDSNLIIESYYVLSGFYRTVGLYDAAIYHMKKAIAFTDSADHNQAAFLTIKTTLKGMNGWVNCTGVLGEYYLLKGDFETSLMYTRRAIAISFRYPLEVGFTSTYRLGNMSRALLQLNKLDSSAYYLDSAQKSITKNDYTSSPIILQVRSLLYIKKGDPVKAEAVLMDCWKMIREKSLIALTPGGVIAPDYYLALAKIAQHKLPEAVELLNSDLERIKGLRVEMLRDRKLLAETYAAIGDHQNAAASYAHYILLMDSLQADQSKFRLQSFETEELITANERSISQLKTDNRISRLLWIFSLGIVLLLIVLALLIYQRYRSKQKDNDALEKTLSDLKTAQNQLVQSEKMASLGELTAGIAHEIQNPLNFVNNFSEVNKELLAELRDEIKKGNLEEVNAIADDVINNEEKINHHGKRADAIVKGMLQHSRSSSGQKEPTDINALCDEYLRLAYHGLRAKDKSFNATLKTDFDAGIRNINIIPQDIGRVILNLITNAFYVVDEKKKQLGHGYEPIVSVSTTKINSKVEIEVADNGNGIPKNILDKIFQPFFTTKPTGQGTGLGLSLAYDIVKAHGGELKVETKEKEGTTFSIQLPANA